ncbi:tyrosine-type recombinase/integrase [Nitrospira sp. T9]|uniref:tyrosine-type recombinase/integrase n=1 Tax=unclassified Nitrospira TaxID=2652172 RepID=UPI003F999E3C
MVTCRLTNYYEQAGPRLKPILLITYHLGMQLGEIFNLTWEQVDLQRRFFTLSERDIKNRESCLMRLMVNVRQALTDLFKVRSLLSN